MKYSKSTKSHLSTKSIQCTSLSLQRVDYIHCCDRLALGVFTVCDCITDDVLQEDLEYTTGLFVDQTTDTFHTATTCQTTDCWLCDTLNRK
jgi:hypothetical protein